MSKIDQKQFEEIVERLDVVTKLLAMQLPATSTLQDRIVQLRDAGLKNVRIAAVLGTSEEYVNVALGRAKKAKAHPSKKR